MAPVSVDRRQGLEVDRPGTQTCGWLSVLMSRSVVMPRYRYDRPIAAGAHGDECDISGVERDERISDRVQPHRPLAPEPPAQQVLQHVAGAAHQRTSLRGDDLPAAVNAPYAKWFAPPKQGELRDAERDRLAAGSRPAHWRCRWCGDRRRRCCSYRFPAPTPARPKSCDTGPCAASIGRLHQHATSSSQPGRRSSQPGTTVRTAPLLIIGTSSSTYTAAPIGVTVVVPRVTIRRR
jgi:hypothetical protein